jgi:hypothetical protein
MNSGRVYFLKDPDRINGSRFARNLFSKPLEAKSWKISENNS